MGRPFGALQKAFKRLSNGCIILLKDLLKDFKRPSKGICNDLQTPFKGL
jgi:hypothetical protein